MKELSKGPRKFYEFLKKQTVGTTITLNEILAKSGWSESTFRTYLGKNILRSFLAPTDEVDWRVLKAGVSLSEDTVAQAFTQARPKEVVLSKGDELPGENEIYTLVDKLGEGAVGHVWRASSESGQQVAVKVMHPRPDLLNPAVISNITERFRREAKNGKKLNHRNVVKYLDRGEWSGAPFIVMELATKSVDNLLSPTKPLSVRRSSEIISACASALRYLHDENCIHRDVKPPNILVGESNFVLGDLGIVKWSDMNPAFTGAGTITKASVQLGSWYYMAPEQLENAHEAIPESDIYALGVTWYELLTGAKPSPAQFAARKYPKPCADSAVCDMIGQMVRYDKSERPPIKEIKSLAKMKSGKND